MARKHTAIVIEDGTSVIKGGFAGQDSPQSILPCVVGTPKYDFPKCTLIGQNALDLECISHLVRPVKRGLVHNWQVMEELWTELLFRGLEAVPREHPILLLENTHFHKSQREKKTEIMFEHFHVPALYLGSKAVMSLASTGHNTGLVLRSGEGITQVVPIFEGHVLPYAVTSAEVAGCQLTRYMQHLLQQIISTSNRPLKAKTIARIKEDVCHVTSNGIRTEPVLYTLPDGQSFEITNEHTQCPELLFEPNLRGPSSPGIQHCMEESILSIRDDESRQCILQTVVLSGGTTLLPGLGERLCRELQLPEEPKQPGAHSVWRGGSIMARLFSNTNVWITRAEYNEVGASIVHRKCF